MVLDFKCLGWSADPPLSILIRKSKATYNLSNDEGCLMQKYDRFNDVLGCLAKDIK
jgi:hypothetical protein